MTSPSMDVAATFRAQAEARPDDVFLTAGERSWTWAETAAQSRALACALQGLGIEPGDRVATLMPNWPEFVLAALATAELGAILVPVNPAHAARELQFVLRNTEATVVVTAERWAGVEYLQLFETLFPELPSLQYLVTVGEEDLWYDDRIFQFEDLVSSGRGQALLPSGVDGDDPAAILYTAGVSAKQKGVVLSHANLLFASRATAEALRLAPEDVTLCTVPLFNIFGLGVALVTAIVSGSSLVLQESFDPEEAVDLAAAHGVTVVHGVPTMFVLLRRRGLLGRRLPELRTGVVAGAPVAADLIRWIRAELAPELEIAYGLTETSPIVSITQPDDEPAARDRTVGRPLDGVEVRILDEGEEVLPVESVGEIVVRGPNVMLGYFRQPGATRSALTSDGFLKTGDLGMLDESGHLHVVGRRSDVIIRGGWNVHPREVEDYLRSLPAVADAAVVGVPNEVLGELVCACIVPVEGALVTEGEIRDLCRAGLAEYKVPDAVRFFDEFPTTSGGSARRAELARRVRMELAARNGGETASPPDA